jgi:hypothetical protein
MKYKKSDYAFKLSEIEQKLREAIEEGYTPEIIINGEYYDVKKD